MVTHRNDQVGPWCKADTIVTKLAKASWAWVCFRVSILGQKKFQILWWMGHIDTAMSSFVSNVCCWIVEPHWSHPTSMWMQQPTCLLTLMSNQPTVFVKRTCHAVYRTRLLKTARSPTSKWQATPLQTNLQIRCTCLGWPCIVGSLCSDVPYVEFRYLFRT